MEFGVKIFQNLVNTSKMIGKNKLKLHERFRREIQSEWISLNLSKWSLTLEKET